MLFARRTPERPLRVIGLMSGTSADAVDGCCVQLWMEEGRLRYEVEATATVMMPEGVRKKLLSVMSGKAVYVHEICTLNFEIGELFAQAALQVMKAGNLDPVAVDAIGSHGQTLYHIPPGTEGHTPSTLQIGEPSIIAQRTGIPTVADFRPRDMAAGGQGAPLVCYADNLLFTHNRFGRCVQNIGGIANVTVLPPMGSAPPVAFDTGPGNMLIDQAMEYFYDRPYDEDGKIAASGQVDPDLVGHLMDQPYLRLPPPKTTGRELFGQQLMTDILRFFTNLGDEDVIATLTYFTARSIADAYRDFVLPVQPVDEVILGGGGVYNKTLVRFLSELLAECNPDMRILTHEDFGIHNKYKEALAFAVLAWATLNNMPGNIPSCTGASQPVILGKILPGDRSALYGEE